MIKMMRVDDRLIHGQVAVMWTKELGIERIIVASDKIAANQVQVSALKMAAPSGVKAAILPIKKAAAIINDPRAEKMKILVISNNPKDLKELAECITEKPVLNIANYGRIGGGNLAEKEKITETVYLTAEDKDIIKEISQMGIEMIYQPLPSDSRQEFLKVMEGK